MHSFLRAYEAHRREAAEAWRLLKTYWHGRPSRVSGMDTVIRLAARIEAGRSIEEAAAQEYLYRWRLAIKAPDQCLKRDCRDAASAVSVFGAPHPIGM